MQTTGGLQNAWRKWGDLAFCNGPETDAFAKPLIFNGLDTTRWKARFMR